VEIRVNDGTSTANLVDQDVIRVPKDHDKFSVLLKLIADEEFEKVLLFVETKRLVNKVSKKLQHSGVRVEHIHGNKTQNYRKKALNRFKDGSIQVLVATDVVARGIDITDITHVINYQIPQSLDSYIHRIGRTGRAGKKGKAFTFID
jgi:ATP-dependent RNA helicase RhlE